MKWWKFCINIQAGKHILTGKKQTIDQRKNNWLFLICQFYDISIKLSSSINPIVFHVGISY
jgi:hypothetical protein